MAHNIFKVKMLDRDSWVKTSHSLHFTDRMNDGAVYNTRAKADSVVTALKKRHEQLLADNPQFEICFQTGDKWVFEQLPTFLEFVIEEYQHVLVASH